MKSQRQGAGLPAVLLLFAVALAVGSCRLFGSSAPLPPAPPPTGSIPAANVGYARDVAPVLENRCVVCHGCYDAPCQLVLSSWEGVERGATTHRVYDSSRLTGAEPTRLFTDETDVEGWRSRGFHSVRAGGEGSASLFAWMLALGRAHTFEPDRRLPDDFPLGLDSKHSCPGDAEFADYARKTPDGGMPYGMAPLPDDDYRTLETWFAAGAPGPPADPPLPASAQRNVAKWEAFLNGASLEERLTARYLYEHWYLAHLSFPGLPEGPWFRVVRSRTPPGEPVDEIATVRPFDDPGVARVWYRLLPVEGAIVHKTHIVYRLDDARLRRLKQLFLAGDWKLEQFPGYAREDASNPFVTFDAIPARSRYLFLLDDARYFVMTFIRGPVCRGQVAVDVIRDHFWVAFVDPDADTAVTEPDFLPRTKHLLRLPAEQGSGWKPMGLWSHYNEAQHEYMELLIESYGKADPEKLGPTLDDVWDGGGRNPNALLTVFRNFDNATVMHGFLGEVPKTAWLIDYPIFERIYYALVAGFDVFGSLTHQVSTRLYMDHLRMQSEDIFLVFLPEDRRDEVRASWYVGATKQVEYYRTNSIRGIDHGTQVEYETDDVTSELLGKLMARTPKLVGGADPLNRCAEPPCQRRGAGPVQRGVERELQQIAATRGPFVALLPEVTLLRVPTGRGDEALVYTLFANRAHKNVAFMFLEDVRRQPEEDTLTILPGYAGSYPNFVFDVPAAEVDGFVAALRAAADTEGLTGVVDRWGVRRTSPRFWETSDWLQRDFRRRNPQEAGLLDLNRYGNL